MRAKTMWAKSWKAAGQCARQHEQPYGCAAAMFGLHERAMKHGSETASIRGDDQNLRHRPTQEQSALLEGGTGG